VCLEIFVTYMDVAVRVSAVAVASCWELHAFLLLLLKRVV